VKKDITRTFKKMLTSNHNRSNLVGEKTYDDASTKYGGSQAVSEIESKFKKKKESAMRRLKSKIYKDEMDDTG